jgi:hypothetical protein
MTLMSHICMPYKIHYLKIDAQEALTCYTQDGGNLCWQCSEIDTLEPKLNKARVVQCHPAGVAEHV